VLVLFQTDFIQTEQPEDGGGILSKALGQLEAINADHLIPTQVDLRRNLGQRLQLTQPADISGKPGGDPGIRVDKRMIFDGNATGRTVSLSIAEQEYDLRARHREIPNGPGVPGMETRKGRSKLPTAGRIPLIRHQIDVRHLPGGISRDVCHFYPCKWK